MTTMAIVWKRVPDRSKSDWRTDGLTEGGRAERERGRKEERKEEGKRDKIRSCNYPAAAAANENSEVSGAELCYPTFSPLSLSFLFLCLPRANFLRKDRDTQAKHDSRRVGFHSLSSAISSLLFMFN